MAYPMPSPPPGICESRKGFWHFQAQDCGDKERRTLVYLQHPPWDSFTYLSLQTSAHGTKGWVFRGPPAHPQTGACSSCRQPGSSDHSAPQVPPPESMLPRAIRTGVRAIGLVCSAPGSRPSSPYTWTMSSFGPAKHDKKKLEKISQGSEFEKQR